jgi:NAD(P)H-dependent FMN reductase
MYKIKIISSTVRPSRKGPIIAKWITEEVKKHGAFDVELLDLGELDLPLLNEPNHPRLKQYEHDHTKQWSAKIDEADAFIFVTAEYDYSYPASLKNALEYLVHEWAFKPAGIVSYSIGPYAGVRATANLRADLMWLKIVPLNEAVHIPTIDKFITDGHFKPNEAMVAAKDIMLGQLIRWIKGMTLIRHDKELY